MKKRTLIGLLLSIMPLASCTHQVGFRQGSLNPASYFVTAGHAGFASSESDLLAHLESSREPAPASDIISAHEPSLKEQDLLAHLEEKHETSNTTTLAEPEPVADIAEAPVQSYFVPKPKKHHHKGFFESASEFFNTRKWHESKRKKPTATVKTPNPDELELADEQEPMLPPEPTELLAGTPHKITLLLPTSGTLAPLGQAVRDGFMTAMQSDNRANKPTVSVLDTQGDNNIAVLYQEAVENGSDFVVGPLTKDGVEQLMRLRSTPIPVLSLNRVPMTPGSKIFQFGLAPEDEASQSALLAKAKGHHNALIIALDNDWGRRVASAYQNTWEEAGGTINDTIFIPTQSDLAGPIRELLHIGASEKRSHQLKNLLGKKIKYEPRRRADIDTIFLATFAREARQIRPLLAYYYANHVPVYATSSIYTGTPSPTEDKDLNQITFCDMPWVLQPKKSQRAMHELIQQLWPKNTASYPRLYALGVDAYGLIPEMNNLLSSPTIHYRGTTGELSITPMHTVARTLPCANFRKGIPLVLSQG